MQRTPPPPPPSSSGPTTMKPPPPPPPPLPQSQPTFDENQLPSVKAKQLTISEESNLRWKTCRFIEEACRILKLPRLVISSAIVIFQRFYAVHTFQDHDRFEVAVACILLAAKTEESPKKLTSVILECYRLKMKSARRGGGSGGGNGGGGKSPTASSNEEILDVNGKEFLGLKERTLLLERVILHTIGFELSIDHPHKFLAEQANKMIISKKLEYIKPDPAFNQLKTQEKQTKMINSLIQKAVGFANDSMLTRLCLQYRADQIAAAILYMSAQGNKMKPTNNSTSMSAGGKSNNSWLDVLLTVVDDLDMDSLISIVKQIIELIADKKGVDRSVFSTVEADLKILKKTMGNSSRSGGGSGGNDRDSKRRRI